MKKTVAFAISLGLMSPLWLHAATLNVGPTEQYKTPCAAFAVAQDGDTILIDPGTYTGDVCAFAQNNLTVEGTSATNRPIINGNGTVAQHKAIWVVSGSNFTVENVEMEGASVAAKYGDNGAAIREQGVSWTVKNCYFHNNQDGILESNVAGSNILIEFSEFANNGVGSGKYAGQEHNLYIGHAAQLTFQYNWSHDAIEGHLLKTRAAVNYILYNRLTGQNGTESYEIDVPNGGTTYVIGNLIQQGTTTHNGAMLSYMEEGANSLNPGHDLYATSNTFVNQYTGSSIFLQIGSADTTPVLAQDNIFYGGGTLSTQSNTTFSGNFTGNPLFVDVNNYNYNLQAGSPAINAATSEGVSSEGYSLVPGYQYVQPTCGETRQNAADSGGLAYQNQGTELNCLP
jgi:hypothetical protein